MGRRGFVLTDLLCVLALCGILAGLLIPTLAAARKISRKKDCANSLKQVGVYFALYESKFRAYPTPGAATWFGLLWRPDLVSDGDLFRCAAVGKKGTGTHYDGITGPGTYTPEGGAKYTWTADGLTDMAPPDLPMACDGDRNGVPNHGAGEDRNVLFFQGRVDAFDIGSPVETQVSAVLNDTNAGWAAPAGTK